MYLPSVAIYMYLPFSLLLVVFNIRNAGSLWINNASISSPSLALSLSLHISALCYCKEPAILTKHSQVQLVCVLFEGWIFVHCTCKLKTLGTGLGACKGIYVTQIFALLIPREAAKTQLRFQTINIYLCNIFQIIPLCV